METILEVFFTILTTIPRIDFMKYGFFVKGERKFYDDNLGVSFGFRVDADTFSEAQI